MYLRLVCDIKGDIGEKPVAVRLMGVAPADEELTIVSWAISINGLINEWMDGQMIKWMD